MRRPLYRCPLSDILMHDQRSNLTAFSSIIMKMRRLHCMLLSSWTQNCQMIFTESPQSKFPMVFSYWATFESSWATFALTVLSHWRTPKNIFITSKDRLWLRWKQEWEQQQSLIFSFGEKTILGLFVFPIRWNAVMARKPGSNGAFLGKYHDWKIS